MKKLALFLLASVFTLSIYSCRETTEEKAEEAIEAAGEDIERNTERAAEEIERGAEEVEREIEEEVNNTDDQN